MRLIAFLVVLAVPWTAGAQTTAASEAQAYYQFLLARHLESQDDMTGALAALERARQLDPTSADIQAELAGFYARQNKGPEAVSAAQAALALDPDNTEAHRMLGLVYAAWASGTVPAPEGRSLESLRNDAIEHLSKILDTPTVATDPNLQLTLARLEMRAGRASEAVPVLERVVAQAPYAVEPYALLAEAQMALGKLDRAADALSLAAEIDPRYYLSLGEVNERRGKWGEAANAYESAVKAMRSPGRELRLRWAGALLNMPGSNGAGKARDVLRDLVQANPEDARALYMLSAAERQIGDFAGAEATARKLLALDPKSLPALSALAQTRFDNHDYRGVLDVTREFEADLDARARGHEEEAAIVLAAIGLAHQQLGEPDRAIAAFSRARDLMPRNAAYDAYIVQAQISAKRYDRALEASADALERHPGDDRLMRLRAEALAGAGRPADGARLLESAIAGDPDNVDLIVALSAAYVDQKQYDRAADIVQAASSRLPDEDGALALQLGAVFEQAGRIDDAERQFRTLLERDPLNATALNYLGYMLADKGVRLPEALDLIQRALAIEPNNPAYLDSLGWALFKQGKAQEAEAPLRKAAAALADNSVIQEHFGDVLAALGRYEEAESAWRRALDGDGESIDRAQVEKKIKDARQRRR